LIPPQHIILLIYQRTLTGVVHHAHMNGIEVAVKFPKIKLTLRGKDLKNFEKEVALQAKVRYELSFQSPNHRSFAC
jgi:hypothetical protein